METQIFRGQVGQVTAGDIVNFNFVKPEADSNPGADLVPAQRRALNDLVRTITEEFDDEPWDVWRIVHAKLGVKSVQDLTRAQFDLAEQVLKDHLTGRREESLLRGLVSKVLRVSSEKDNRAEVELFCSRNFGTSQFKLLTREQLQATLGFAHDWAPPKSAYEHEPPATHPAKMAPSPLPAERRFTWHWLAVTLLLGFILGRFF
ncbi:hypothetical protein [Bordetella pseudohinzii]|uniref:Flagella biosynthesis regulator n=1 Tax=Bordetella pseudohinzii TaxID=1331258 RepID=A0A0M7CZC0_9BORD|nr:hypothetical protein [Bordetella pseudohinzii]ANY15918.1 hypothetical protein BBN53_08425 [Bordetella pseudohinzii]KXA75902.1 hypothetical protein AW877_18500 [Bordetella pseudohinzii]KXA78976.1 hypothetical protein AW878_11510 [Bordetella pseudohinzii]CUI46250.1 flagella biosynthesis regulator [Bordetella pseudohinzii]